MNLLFKTSEPIKIILAGLALLLSVNAFAQNNNSEKIIGTWLCTHTELLRIMDDSLRFFESSKNSLVTFEKGNKFSGKKTTDSLNINVINGTYRLSADGVTLIQNEVSARIIKLTEKELQLKIEGEFILYFRKFEGESR